MAGRKCISSSFLGRKNQRTLNACQRLHSGGFPLKAYCSLSTSIVSKGSSGKKGLPEMSAHYAMTKGGGFVR